MFGELKADTGAFERSLLSADAKLESVQKELTQTEQKSKSLGDVSATVARRYEKLNETISAQRTKLHQAADAYKAGDINARQLANALLQVDRAAQRAGSSVKDAAARTKEIGQTGASHFQNQIRGATGGFSDLAAIFTGNRLSGATTQITAAGEALSAIPGPAGLAAAAIAVIGTATVGAAVGLVNMAKAAADYGSEIFDATQKTGLSAESISTLKFNADNAGSSLDQVTGAIAKFAKNVDAAAGGSKEAAKNLAELGIEPVAAANNLDNALDTVFKRIANATPGIEQITLAQKAFGKSGADLIPVILQMGGNFEEAKKRAEELGITLTDKAAQAADDFGDKLGALGAQAKAVGTNFALEFADEIGGGLDKVSALLSENKDIFIDWGTSIGNVLSGVQAILSAMPGELSGITAALKTAVALLIPPLAALERIGYHYDQFAPGPDPTDQQYLNLHKKIRQRVGGGALVTEGDLSFSLPGSSGTSGKGESLADKFNREFGNAYAGKQAIYNEALKAEKEFAVERKKMIDESIRQAKEFAAYVKQLQSADSQKFNKTIDAYNLRADAKNFAQGFISPKGTVSQELQQRLQALLGTELKETIIGFAEGGARGREAITRTTIGFANPKLNDADRQALNQKIIELTQGLDPAQLTGSQNAIAAQARKQEADRIEKERDKTTKELIKAIQEGALIHIINQAPDNARVTRRPRSADVVDRVGN